MVESLEQIKDEEGAKLPKRASPSGRPVLIILAVLMGGMIGLFFYLRQVGSSKAPVKESRPPSKMLSAPSPPSKPPSHPEKTLDKRREIPDRVVLHGPIKEFSEKGEIQSRDKVVEIQDGDTLSELAMKIYGRYFSGNIHSEIRKANPQISSLSDIHPGQKITFPDVPLSLSTEIKSFFSVNVASLQTREKTQNSIDILIKNGYRGFVAPVRLPDDNKLFWVMAGQFSTKKSAEEAATILKKKAFDDARVMYVDPKKGHIVRGEKALDLY